MAEPGIDSRDPALLHPILQVLVKEFMRIAKSQGVSCGISGTVRDKVRQDYYYNVKHTTTVKGGYSYHQYGIAVDIVPLDSKGNLSWPDPDPRWAKLGAIGQSIGFDWGGAWAGFVDRPHYEVTFGLSCAQLYNGAQIPKTISKGCKSKSLVKYIQRLLNITPDGVFGNDTYNAVRQYNATGEIDAGLLQALIDKANEPPKPTKPEVIYMDEFKDVPADHYSAAAFKELLNIGIFNGYTDSKGQRVAGFNEPMPTERVVQLLWNTISYLKGE